MAEDPDLKGRSNIYILEADVTKYSDLQNAAVQTAKITGGNLDYLIANAAQISTLDGLEPIGNL